MRLYLLDKLVCPHCQHFPLAIKMLEEREGPTLEYKVRPCHLYCAYEDRRLGKDPKFDPPCSACLSRQIWAGYLYCTQCNSRYPINERILSFVNDDVTDEWVAEEKTWWEEHYQNINRQTNITIPEDLSHVREVPGNRAYERNKYLFNPLRDKGVAGQVVLEIGAGTSQHVSSLLVPIREHCFYVATDVARAALRIGVERLPEGDFIQCTVSELPFRRASIDVLLSLGVLHHVPSWQMSLMHILEFLNPGGWMLFNEAIDKPRVFGVIRKRSLTAAIDSPHEGEVVFDELLAILKRQGTIVAYHRQTTPLRVALVWMLGNLMERSVLVTKSVLAADQILLKSIGQFVKSLGPGESLGIFEKTSVHNEDSRRS